MSSEEYLRSVTLGELVPHDATIHLAEYDASWPSRFQALAARIRAALGADARVLEHVGSTSVPGLAAKPVIDLVLAVPDSDDEAAYVPALERQGFTLRIREPEWFRHRLLKPQERDANLHVFSAGCEEIARMIRFRDWLRGHDEDRLRYEGVKRELSRRTWKHVQEYADAKTQVVLEIMARASAS